MQIFCSFFLYVVTFWLENVVGFRVQRPVPRGTETHAKNALRD